MQVDGLMLCDDLIFFSRVGVTARASGLVVKQVRTAAELQKAALDLQPACVIVDLQNPGLDLPELLGELKACCRHMPRVVAFGSHVEAETLRAARKAGCETVMPRSQFAESLDQQLPAWLKSRDQRSTLPDSSHTK